MAEINEIKEFGERLATLEKMYNALTKKQLVSHAVIKDLSEDSFMVIEDKMSLWCYVSDSTGVRYLTNKRPTKYFTDSCPLGFFMTDGDVNIRIPDSMGDLFPPLVYGDEPVVVKLSVSF